MWWRYRVAIVGRGTDEIAEMMQLALINKQAFLTSWMQNINLLLERAILLPITLPETYRHYPGANQYNGNIELDKLACKQMLIDAGKMMADSNCSMKNINAAIKNQLAVEVKKQLKESWSFLPKNEIDPIINKKIQQP